MASVDWPGLLTWSTKYHDGTAPTEFKRMSKEDKEFLEKAMEDAFSKIEDFNKVLDDGLRKLEAAEDAETAIVACEIIDRCVDDPDCARNLEVFNGIAPLLKNALSTNADVSERCCSILSMMLANNEQMQKAAIGKHKALEVLFPRGSADERLLQTRKKIKLLADIVRGLPEAEEAFITEHVGIGWLCRALLEPPRAAEQSDSASSSTSEYAAVRERVVTFLRHLLAASGDRVRKEEVSLAGTLAYVYSNESHATFLETASLQYTENLAQLTLVAAKESPVVAVEVEAGVKRRMEFLLRKATDPETAEYYAVEIEELKAILALAKAAHEERSAFHALSTTTCEQTKGTSKPRSII
ncbi:unnamed protein product [Amoebophrya sp. A25]|nr:unnamed protein product [Amoebophrya sp. A25]|eukprot:GSA25T00019074001.1